MSLAWLICLFAGILPTLSIYSYFVDADNSDPGDSSHLQGLHELSLLDTEMSTNTKSNVLAHLIYTLLFVII